MIIKLGIYNVKCCFLLVINTTNYELRNGAAITTRTMKLG